MGKGDCWGEGIKMVLWFIVPCFNERAILRKSCEYFYNYMEALKAKGKISKESKVVFVNDGSNDGSVNILKELVDKYSHIKVISLSNNCGHQNAILAGLTNAAESCDAAITMDCDGQDDISIVEEMLDAYKAGNEIVYAVRSDRKTDSFLKRSTAELYYKILNAMGCNVIYNHADFRLMGSKALKALTGFKEVNLFLRGLIPMMGFRNSIVYYERKTRIGGETHYTLGKMIKLACDGITSLSIKPIRIITGCGGIASFIGFIGIIYAIVMHFCGKTVWGWTSMICVICFIGGIQLLSIGIIGEYVGKIYLETKRRPRYIIEEEFESK